MKAIPAIVADRPAVAENAVIFCVDANFLPYAAHAASQIAALHPGRDFDICIVHTNKLTLPDSLSSLGIRMVTFEQGEMFGGQKLGGRFTESTYYRLALPELFKADYRRILYLDADIHVQGGDFGALLRADLRDRPIAAVLDSPNWHLHDRVAEEFETFGLGKAPYFNSGVMLMDVAHCCETGLLERCIAFGQANAHQQKHFDQTLLNCVLHGNWAELSPVWNWQYYNRGQLFEAIICAHIVHFPGPNKPWNAAPEKLPPRFARALVRFLRVHFPDRVFPVPAGPRTDQMGKTLIRHYFARHRATRYLARFETDLTVLS